MSERREPDDERAEVPAMTSDQLKDLMKVLDNGSVAALGDHRHCSSRDWRRENVHTTRDVSIGALVRESHRYGELD